MNTIHRIRLHALASVIFLACAHTGAFAQQVAFVGALGNKAMLIVDGGRPRAVSPGESIQGVKLLSVDSNQAVIEVNGKKAVLHMGSTPATLGVARGTIQMKADRGGHFTGEGKFSGNARSAGKIKTFMVDTGATSVVMDQNTAADIGLESIEGRRITMVTANGTTYGTLAIIPSITIGTIEVRDIEAVVVTQDMPIILLGNSYLQHFRMTRTSEEMILVKN